jgi:hypothetical protein
MAFSRDAWQSRSQVVYSAVECSHPSVADSCDERLVRSGSGLGAQSMRLSVVAALALGKRPYRPLSSPHTSNAFVAGVIHLGA